MSKIKHELSGWIETDVIAEHILEELEEQGIQPTLENAKTVWLDVLENELCEAIKSSVKARFDAQHHREVSRGSRGIPPEGDAFSQRGVYQGS